MRSVNKAVRLGHVGGMPEMRFTPQGKPVCTFRVATNHLWKTPTGEQKKETEWITVVTFDKQAESCNKYLKSGSRVYIEGRIRTRSWEAQDGQKRYSVELIAREVNFLDPFEGQAQEEPQENGDEDEVPF